MLNGVQISDAQAAAIASGQKQLVRFAEKFLKIRLRVPVFFLEDFLLVLCVMLALSY